MLDFGIFWPRGIELAAVWPDWFKNSFEVGKVSFSYEMIKRKFEETTENRDDWKNRISWGKIVEGWWREKFCFSVFQLRL